MDGSRGPRSSHGTGTRAVAGVGCVLATVAVVAAALVAFTGTAAAHGAAVETPPIPLLALFSGAAFAVGGTAVALAVGPDPPTGRVRLGAVHARTVRVIHAVVRAGAVVALAVAVVAGLTSTAAVSFAEVFVWPVLFKGSLVVAAVVGSPWRLVSPWHLAYDAISAVEGDELGRWSYPDRLGSWPAVVGLVAVVGVAENLTVVPDDGRLTVVLLAAYGIAAVLAAVAFGREALRRADALAVLYRLAGRVAPLAFERDDDRVIAFLRPPWVGSTRPLRDVSTAAFVVVAAGTVTFDGAVETAGAARALAELARFVGAYAGLVLYGGVLVAFLAGAVLTRRAVAAAAGASAVAGDGGRVDDGGDPAVDRAAVARRQARVLAATLLPIAVAYDVAHNYAYVLVNATRALDRAADAAGVALALDPGSALAPVVVWTTQVALVVGGHLVAVVAAHLATERTFPDPRRARRGHAPLAALMVAYTVVSLYVLAAA